LGVIFELTVEDMAKLDEVEKGYERTAIWVDGPKGRVSLLTVDDHKGNRNKVNGKSAGKR
jgi:hypothetical protein